MTALPAGQATAADLCVPHLLSFATMTDLPDLPDTPTGRYRHVKGGEYEVLGVVRHSESLEPMVLYRALSSGTGLWVRPHAMFFETVVVNGQSRPRFTRLDTSSD